MVYVLPITSSLGAKLNLKSTNFHYKIIFCLVCPALQALFLSQGWCIITEFGILIRDLCGDPTGVFIFSKFYLISNQEGQKL